MKNFWVLLLLLFIPYGTEAQAEWSGKTFYTSCLIGSTDYGWSTRNQRVTLADAGETPWGYFIKFNADGTFLAYNQNRCGNDCRVKVTGNYKIEGDQLSFVCTRIRFLDMCAFRPMEVVETDLGTFQILFESEGIELIRI